MSGSANVTSIDALKELRTAMAQFGFDADAAIAMLTLEARKAIEWLMHDRARYWPVQLRKAEQLVFQSRNDLERCQLHFGSEEAPSCFEQRKALERAKRRLRECEEKVQAVKRWTRAIREEIDRFDSEMVRWTNWSEAELPRAIAALDRMITALDKYSGESG